MTIDMEYIESDLQLAIHVTCKDVLNIKEINIVFDDLNEALKEIEVELGKPREDTVFYHLIKIAANGASSGPGQFDPHEGVEYSSGCYNPWEAFCPDFWTKAVANQELRERARYHLTRIEEILMLAGTLSRSTDSLWEDDETQFGEPVATHLALLDIDFVPYYTRLLRLWDMDHEVNTFGSIELILNTYGLNLETKALRDLYLERSGSDGCGLLEIEGAQEN